MTARELLEAPAFVPNAELGEGELERVYWAYRGLKADLERERRFFGSTNEALATAYEQLDARKEEVERARERIERMNETLDRRVEEGIAALREAERLAAYGQLVAGVVHEVRQPLFAIKTVAFLLADARGERDGDVAVLDVLRRESARLESLMEDLLDFAKPLRLAPAAVDVQALLDQAVQAFRMQAPGAALEFALRSEGALTARCDPSRITQVLLNLLHNAHRHAAGATRVELEASRDPRGVIISVENDGAPIPADVVARVFDPFFSTGKGTGLGLAIARRIVEAHGGTMAVAPLECGTRFTVALPVPDPEPRGEAA